MQPKVNYVALLILIILGVALGNLASSFIATNYFTKERAKELKPVSKELPKEPPIEHSRNIELERIKKPLKNKEAVLPEPVRETVKLSPDGHEEVQNIETPTDSKELIAQRKLDENGLRLAKRCNEWTTVHKDMNTPSSERGMNKHCSEYYDYLSFGTLPNSN